MNKRKSYVLTDSLTGKVIKYHGRFQYFRLKQMAIVERSKLQHELGKKLEIKKLDSGNKKGMPIKKK